jgi:hypothetical protein
LFEMPVPICMPCILWVGWGLPTLCRGADADMLMARGRYGWHIFHSHNTERFNFVGDREGFTCE